MQDIEMLTFKEAVQAFKNAGLSESTFRKRVKDGIIQTHMPEGRQRGAFYPKDQVLTAIDTTSKATRPKSSKRNIKTSIFTQASPADMVDIAPLLMAFYGSRISIEKRAAWIERNPKVCYMLKSEDQVVGCAFIMPLEEQKIMQILSSQVKPPTRPSEILLYEPGKHVDLYVRAAGVTQAVSKDQRKHWAARLIKGLASEVIRLGEMGINIGKIYAQGDTVAGEHALKKIGFMQIDINAPTTRKNFMLDIQKSGSIWAMKYKHALNTWRAMNEEE